MRFSAASTADRLLPEPLAARARPFLDRLDSVVFTADDRGQASRTSLTAFGIRIVSAAIALISQIMMARWMGGFEYGIFVLVWTAMIIVGNLSCLGFHTSIVRYIPEYRERGRLGELRGVMAASRAFVLATSTLFAAAGLIGLWLFSDAVESYYVVPFYLGIVCLPMIALSDTLEGTARANSWAILALAPIYLLRPVLILALMGAAIFAGYLPDAKTGIVVAIVATYATTLFQLAAIAPQTGREVRDVPPLFRIREWVVVSLPIFLVEGFFFMLTNADVLMVGWFMNPDDVAVYFATVKTLALVHFVYFAVKAGVAQRYAQYAHGGNPEKLAAFARETVAWTFWPSLAMGAAVLVIGKPMLALFGPGFDAGYPLLFVLVAGVVARASVGPAESLLTMSGNQNICAVVYGVTLAINVILNVFLIPLYGLWGAAISTAVAMACEAAMLSFTVWRRLGIVMIVPLPGRNNMGVA
ncbi:MAG: lipopolysaccharide biosynthesis protein [Neoaquamicrobium sediminum]|uniref:lipopolysaccharide biosynthesis protein n=1 Tax=Neoaquamicrobium sediminum TaxID=1849104 RepID=UPI004036E214